ncbi:MAG: histidinol-phosphate transaminase [Gammaproteobacteria bacterium]
MIKLASNENPLGPSPKALDLLQGKMNSFSSELNRYPDGNAYELKEAISKKYTVDPNQITIGNGSNDLIEFVSRCFLGEGKKAIYSQHGFAIYPLAIKATGALSVKSKAKNWGHDLELMSDLIDDKTKVIFIASPNNPTGTAKTLLEIKDFLNNLPDDILVFLDQAYYEYIEGSEFDIPFSLINDHPNLVISRSFSKAHGLAALRLGFCVSNPELSNYLNRVRQPFNANSLALDLGKVALSDQEHISKSVKINSSGMDRVKKAFTNLDYDFIKSWGNFISFDAKQDSDIAFQYFLEKGVILRSLKVYEMPQHLRVSIGTEEEMDFFLQVLEDYEKDLSKK